MTSKKPKDINWPVPLRTRDNSLGAAVREYAQATEETGGETASYARVLARVARRSRRVPMIAAGLAMAGGLTAVALVVRHRAAVVSAPQSTLPASAPLRRSTSIEASPPVAQTPPVPRSQTAWVNLGTLPASLPAGRVDLVGQATAVLSADAVASARAQAGTTEVVLSKGSIELRVRPRPPGQQFAVNAGPYRFTVVGTAFTVAQTGSRIELVVSEGTVAVSRGPRRLATVGAGAEWAVDVALAAGSASRKVAAGSTAELTAAEPVTGIGHELPRVGTSPRLQTARAQVDQASGVARVEPPSPTAPPLTPSPATPAAIAAAPPVHAAPTPAAPIAVRRDCEQLAASARDALTCYQDQAVQGGLAGETAQYQVARLWRDSLGEPGRALAAFQTQRSRFPNGVLRTEADLSIVELLPRLGRHAEALAESEQFLAAHPKAERSGEIHLLRGNIFREVLRDLDHAEREYARGAESDGRVGDDSRFLRAVCLEALGRVDEARKAYEAYLLRTGVSHAQEAKKRLDGLRP